LAAYIQQAKLLDVFCTARIGRADIDVANRAVDKLLSLGLLLEHTESVNAKTVKLKSQPYAQFELSGATTLLSPE
jgi:hypothetical protein